MFSLGVITASTRPGRIGPAIASWFRRLAIEESEFEVREVDLVDFDLPVFDEPHHPRTGRYVHDHTIAWSRCVRDLDAVVAVSPEYNYFAPPSLVNAFDYLSAEWAYKPLGLVTYGGLSGGLRSAQMIKLQATTLRMYPISDGVGLPFAARDISDGEYHAPEPAVQAARAMLAELAKVTPALASLRG